MIPSGVTFSLYNHGGGWYGVAQASGRRHGTLEEFRQEHPALAHLSPHLNGSDPRDDFWIVSWGDSERHTDPRRACDAICRIIEAAVARQSDATCEAVA